MIDYCPKNKIQKNKDAGVDQNAREAGNPIESFAFNVMFSQDALSQF